MSLGSSHALIASRRLARSLLLAAFSLLATALVFDLVDLTTGTGALGLPAYWLTAAGLVSGIAAGLCRIWPVKAVASRWAPWPLTGSPGFFKAVALVLFAASWSLRTPESDLPLAALVMALLAIGFLIAAPWVAGPGTQVAGGLEHSHSYGASAEESRPSKASPTGAR